MDKRALAGRLRRTIRRSLPESVVNRTQQARAQVASRTAARVLREAPLEPEYLPEEMLDVLFEQYRPPPAYGYDQHAVERRGESSAALATSVLDGLAGKRVLEIGADTGMASAAVMRRGGLATALDLSLSHLDPRAREAGITAVEGDAAKLPFDDATFDGVFSHNSFEHIDDPMTAATEALRVLVPGGTFWSGYGPLYGSALGLHAYRSIPIPYCQHLWPLDTIERYLESRGVVPRLPYVNGLSLARHREIWRTAAVGAVQCSYREVPDIRGLSLVRRFPSCFAARSRDIDEFLITEIHVVLSRPRR